MLRAYSFFQAGKPEEIRNTAIKALLNSDLESGQGHRYDLLIDRSIMDWKKLEEFCKWMIEPKPNDLMNRSLLAYCHYKAGNINDAKNVILKAEAENPRHPHVAAIKAYIMRSLGDDNQARASLGIALSGSEILSAWLMRAKYCESEQNLTCMQEALDKIYANTNRSLPYYALMAKLTRKKNDRKKALDWVARGQSLSQTYLPLSELKNSL